MNPRRFLLPVAALAILATVGVETSAGLEGAVGRAAQLGPWGALVLAALAIPAAVLGLPISVLSLGAGFTAGLGVGAVAAWLGAVLGSTVAFLVGRACVRHRVAPWLARDGRLLALDRALERDGFRTVLLLRVSPVLPRNLLNYALALTRVSLRDYVLATSLGSIPGVFFACWVGSTARSLSEARSGSAGQLAFAASVAASAIGLTLLGRTARRWLRTGHEPEVADRPAT